MQSGAPRHTASAREGLLATVPAPAHAARTVPGLRAGLPAAEPSTEPPRRPAAPHGSGVAVAQDEGAQSDDSIVPSRAPTPPPPRAGRQRHPCIVAETAGQPLKLARQVVPTEHLQANFLHHVRARKPEPPRRGGRAHQPLPRTVRAGPRRHLARRLPLRPAQR